jgi:hypothetical protein
VGSTKKLLVNKFFVINFVVVTCFIVVTIFIIGNLNNWGRNWF